MFSIFSCTYVFFAAAATAKSLQSFPTLCDPIDSSPPGSLSLGFSRQEHWSGLPFPSPMHESENRKWSRSAMSDSSRPHGLQPTRLLCPWDFPGKSTGVGSHCLLRMFSLEKCLFRSSAHFKIKLFGVCCWVIQILYVFWILNPY